MFGYIISPYSLQVVQKAFQDRHQLFGYVGDFTVDEFIKYCQAASSISLDILVIDIRCCPDEGIIKGIRQFRVRNNARIILLAPGRQPGDPTISQLVNLSVWDIIAPSFNDENDELDEEDKENEELQLASLISKQLQMKFSYGNASRWHNVYEQEIPAEKKEIKKKKETVTEPEIIYRDRIVGQVIIAIGSIGRRTGCTRSSLQCAMFLQNEGYKVACVELVDASVNPIAFDTFKVSEPSKLIKGGFHLHGIDFFPQSDMETYLQIISAPYQYVVVDLGQIVNFQSNNMQLTEFGTEFIRCDFQILTATPALWDVQNLVNTLDVFFELNWDRQWNFLINLTNDRSFKEFSGLFTSKEKEKLKIEFYKNCFEPDPWVLSNDQINVFKKMLKPILPSSDKRKKRFLLF